MNALAAPKSDRINRLEAFALIAMFQGFPTFAAAVLMLKLTGAHEIVGERYGAAIFVTLATLLYALITPPLARKFPRFVKNGPDPLFYDASLSFAEKVAKWRTQPTASLQLLSSMILLSLLAVGVASLG